MIGDYSAVGSWESCSLEAEQAFVRTLREHAARAEAIDPAGLDDQQRLTREVIVDTASSNARVTDTPLTGLSANPVSGPQRQLALSVGLMSVLDAAVAEQMPAKLESAGAYLHQLAERT